MRGETVGLQILKTRDGEMVFWREDNNRALAQNKTQSFIDLSDQTHNQFENQTLVSDRPKHEKPKLNKLDQIRMTWTDAAPLVVDFPIWRGQPKKGLLAAFSIVLILGLTRPTGGLVNI